MYNIIYKNYLTFQDYEPVQFRQSLPSHTQPPPAPTLHRKSPIHQGGGGHHLPPHPSFQGGGVRPPPPLYKPVPQYPNQVGKSVHLKSH